MIFATIYRYGYINQVQTTTTKQAFCGSDSIYRLDGRNKLSTMAEKTCIHIEKLKNVHSDIVAFTIHRGTISKSTIVYDSNPELKIV